MSKRAVVAWGVLVGLVGCGDPPPAENRCTPGLTISCPCLGGSTGVQTCQATGVYGACMCLPAPDASTDAATADAILEDRADVATDVGDAPRPPDDVAPDVAPDVALDVAPDVAPDVTADAALDGPAPRDASDAATDVAVGADVADVLDVVDAMDVADVSDASDVAAAMDALDAGDVAAPGDAPQDVGAGDVADGAVAPVFCAPGAVVDLAAVGSRAGTITRYAGSNTAVPLDLRLLETCGAAAAPVVHRYTTSAEARLTLSTQNAGTTAGFDTVLAVLNACGQRFYGSGVSMLACSDDEGGATLPLASTVVLPRVPAGTTLFVVVAGHATASTPRGAYVLTVAEAPLASPGASCDRAGLASACGEGYSCSFSDPPRCLLDSTLGARCASAYPTCGDGLGCLQSQCVVASTTTSCTPVCPSTSGCIRDASGMSRCVPNGSSGGRCRPSTAPTPCDPGLACARSGNCGPAVPVGGRCDATGLLDACVAGASCVAGTCVREGAITGLCRRDLTQPACDGTLECSSACTSCGSATCIAPVPAGASCEPPGGCSGGCVLLPCAEGSSCGRAPGATTFTCRPDGGQGLRCRRSRTLPLCDAGLTCVSRAGTCMPTLAAGTLCDSGSVQGCAAGTLCLPSAGVSRCLPAPYAESTVPATGYIDACATGRVEPMEGTSVRTNITRAPLALPFPFTYFGVPQSWFAAGTGAWGSFGTTRPTGASFEFRDSTLPVNAVAPYTQRVEDTRGIQMQAAGSRICSATAGVAPNRRFAVEWRDFTVADVGTAAHLTFEVVMHEGTNVIEFFYRQLDPTTGPLSRFTDGTRATIGLTGPAGEPPVIHRGPVSTASGLRFTPR